MADIGNVPPSPPPIYSAGGNDPSADLKSLLANSIMPHIINLANDVATYISTGDKHGVEGDLNDLADDRNKLMTYISLYPDGTQMHQDFMFLIAKLDSSALSNAISMAQTNGDVSNINEPDSSFSILGCAAVVLNDIE